MTHNSYGTAEVLDFDALMNSQVSGKDVASLVSERVTNSGPPPRDGVESGSREEGVDSSSQPNPPVTQNSGQATSLPLLDLTRPVKTEGEASPSLSTVSHPPPTASATLLSSPHGTVAPSSVSGAGQTSSTDATGGSTALPLAMPSSASIGAFGSPLTALGAQLKLTPEEQAAAYKKANILALSALAKKGGPNAREMLAVQAKLQEFLTNLISLAGNSGQQLKSTVQLLVQQLVTGTISEQEFAMRIEKDLHSQHQPSLLPFLQSSVPHLRTRLQLQQAIMKELLHRQAQEKLQKTLQSQKQAQDAAPMAVTTPPSTNNAVTVRMAQQGVVGMLGPALGAGKAALVQQQLQNQHHNQQIKLSDGGVSLAQLQQSLGVGAQLAPLAPSSVSQSHLTPSNSLPTSTTSVSLPSSATTPASSSTPLSSSSSSSSSSLSLGSIPLPISATAVTAQIRAQLNKMSPQQQLQYMQQLKKQTQQQNSTPFPASKLQPPASQQLLLASQKLGIRANTALMSPQATSTNSSSVGAPSMQLVQEQQQRLVKEQQLTMMGAGSKPTATGASVGGVSVGLLGSTVGQVGRSASGGSVSPSRQVAGQSKTSFVDLKVQGSNHSTSPVSSVGVGKGKARVKTEAGKTAADEEEEEDDDMDFSGVKTVNLQAESILPTTLGETMRTVKDEAFFDLTLLRRKVMAIAHRYSVPHIADDYLVLLSHAIQERLRDILEKVTVVSQHRTESLKDEEQYEVSSEVRGQLKVLESIDKLNHKRKQEREKEQILKAARSRSKAEDPEAAAKIKEQAKRLQQEEEQKIRDRAANEAALAAIGSRTKRKRSSAVGLSDGAMGGLLSSLGPEAGSGHTSLLGAQATSRQPKRRVTSRDLIFFMEQAKETKKSLVLYKSFLK